MVVEQDFKLWQKAVSFAARQHSGQLRKDGRTPYFAHPVRVAMTVRDIFEVGDPEVLAAAILHDVIEDTTTDYDDLLQEFGRHVADLVASLTKDSRLPEEEREERYDAGLIQAPWSARLIKLADVFDNYSDTRNDSERAKVAIKAKRAIQCAGDDPRLQKAVNVVQELIS